MNVHLVSSVGFPTPFLRPAAPPHGDHGVPDGWVAEPAGEWRGRAAEVVYDPRRHDVMVSEGLVRDDASAALCTDGWMRCAVEGGRTLWARDRIAATREALARLAEAAAAELALLPGAVRGTIGRPEPGRGLGR